MAKVNTRGWYTFADGSVIWFSGLSAQEKRNEVYKHGKIMQFEPTE